MRWLGVLLGVLGALGTASAAPQKMLRVSPTLLDVHAPTAATTVRFWNDSEQPINVQVRLFRWTQSGGQEQLVPTEDVAVSPPLTTLRPGSENVIRVVRTSKAAAQREESYRIVVDELPDPGQRQQGTVALVVRHSIPVFFAPSRTEEANVTWSLAPHPKGLMVTARNSGGSRLRVANLKLSDGNRTVARRGGLLGYALAGSSASWLVPTEAEVPGGPLEISATSEAGPISAVASREGS